MIQWPTPTPSSGSSLRRFSDVNVPWRILAMENTIATTCGMSRKACLTTKPSAKQMEYDP